MKFVNRSALLLILQEPFLKWANALPDHPQGQPPFEMDEINAEPEIILIPEYDDEDGFEEILDEYWADIFEDSLASWTTNQSTWPKDRTKDMFEQWFSLVTGPLVKDVVGGKFELEDTDY